MTDEAIKKLIATAATCADKAAATEHSIEALQFTQAAVNAANAVRALSDLVPKG